MRSVYIAIIVIIAIVVSVKSSYAKGIVLPGKVFISPDKNYSFKIEDYDRVYHFVVKDLSSGKVTSFEVEHNPIFSVKWTFDSKSIFIVAHYARGKLLDMIHNDGGKWTLGEITPPENREYECEILDWNFKKDYVRLTFKVMIYSRASPEYYKCSFDYNPSTGLRSNYSKSLLSFDTYRDTKSSLAPD